MEHIKEEIGLNGLKDWLEKNPEFSKALSHSSFMEHNRKINDDWMNFQKEEIDKIDITNIGIK